MRFFCCLLFVWGLLFPGGLMAAQKCVAVEPTALMGCSGNVDPGSRVVDWKISCFNDVVKTMVYIHGVAVCASSAESGPLDNLTVSDNGNSYCWCRAISPFVTSWIRGSAPTDECGWHCSMSCSMKPVGDYLENIMVM